MNGKCFCPLGDTATWFVMSAFKAFREEFEAHCGAGTCPVRAARPQLVTGVVAADATPPARPTTASSASPSTAATLRVAQGHAGARRRHELGIHIPIYCAHPKMEPVAVCRMCLVHVEKMPKLQPACAT